MAETTLNTELNGHLGYESALLKGVAQAMVIMVTLPKP